MQLRRCATCDVDLEGYGDTVRGFEFAEGQYVLERVTHIATGERAPMVVGSE